MTTEGNTEARRNSVYRDKRGERTNKVVQYNEEVQVNEISRYMDGNKGIITGRKLIGVSKEYRRKILSKEKSVPLGMGEVSTLGKDMGKMVAGEAFVIIPCCQAVYGELCLLSDTGADTSLVKRESLKHNVEADKSVKKLLDGAFGGGTTTAGLVKVQHAGDSAIFTN